MAHDTSINTQTLFLGDYEKTVRATVTRMEKEHFGKRLWHRDASLWKTGKDEQKTIRDSLGWLPVAEEMLARVDGIHSFIHELWTDGFTDALLMGMGGSSLAPLVFQRSFPQGRNGLRLHVLDTTDPATILATEENLPLLRTLFIIASKSGTTAEPAAFGEYFFEKVKSVKGALAGRHFAAITDPRTPLAELGAARGFRKVFLYFADIGGRYSALSYFGLLPAAIFGIPIRAMIEGAVSMSRACGHSVRTFDNPGVMLGAAMGALAREGCNKLTLLLTPSIAPLGMWIEQLIAESTGKEGTGILPIDVEPMGAVRDYGDDRFFVYMRLASEPDENLEKFANDLKMRGRPLAVIELKDLLAIGQEFFRWEIATAAAGSILEINPFDQPNVQESKDSTNHILAAVKEMGRLPELPPVAGEGPLQFYGREAAQSGGELLGRFLASAHRHDYIALQAYLTETSGVTALLQDIRSTLRAETELATTMGFGPRFLHSTGQFHKGGPDIGLFLQLTSENPKDVAIPGAGYTFGMFRQAQAIGDMESLIRRGRRILRIHLGADMETGIIALHELLKASFAAGNRG